jgi:hypothetical protein
MPVVLNSPASIISTHSKLIRLRGGKESENHNEIAALTKQAAAQALRLPLTVSGSRQ